MRAIVLLKEDHRLIERALTLFERLVVETEQGRLPDLGRLARLTEFFEHFVDHAHHRKEEEVLFPALEEHGLRREGGPIGCLIKEHAQGRSLLAILGSGDRTDLVIGGKAYSQMLRQHIEKENQVLFVLAGQLLPPTVHDAVWRRFEELEGEQGSLRVSAEQLVRLLEAARHPERPPA